MPVSHEKLQAITERSFISLLVRPSACAARHRGFVKYRSPVRYSGQRPDGKSAILGLRPMSFLTVSTLGAGYQRQISLVVDLDPHKQPTGKKETQGHTTRSQPPPRREHQAHCRASRETRIDAFLASSSLWKNPLRATSDDPPPVFGFSPPQPCHAVALIRGHPLCLCVSRPFLVCAARWWLQSLYPSPLPLSAQSASSFLPSLARSRLLSAHTPSSVLVFLFCGEANRRGRRGIVKRAVNGLLRCVNDHPFLILVRARRGSLCYVELCRQERTTDTRGSVGPFENRRGNAGLVESSSAIQAASLLGSPRSVGSVYWQPSSGDGRRRANLVKACMLNGNHQTSPPTPAANLVYPVHIVYRRGFSNN